MHVITSLHARCVHAHHHACNLLSPVYDFGSTFLLICLDNISLKTGIDPEKLSGFLDNLYTGCLPNNFSQFQGFQGFFNNFLAVLWGFLVKFLPVFKVLLKKFFNLYLQIANFKNFRKNFNIRRLAQTQKWVIYHALIVVSILTNKV